MNQKKREETLIKKYGSAEALKAERQKWQAKSRIKYKGGGGLRALSEERRREISKLGNQKRWGKKNETKDDSTA